ncbi:unnamed protein product [Mytilus coruscus]|uniref:Plastocyanin-like domain-containing protein n=1 Tax=Mytilus coruscus TaxID=42192 RepID=A0A6J8B7A8_MYTCO|nr:unnamed protein product [Mytilus coruscus]
MLFILDGFSAQSTDTDWFNYFLKTGTSCKINTCRQNDTVCECFLSIKIDLSMLYKGAGSPAILLKPQIGAAVNFNTGAEFDENIEDSFILADGFNSQQVISINGRFSGPVITAYENQNMIVHVRNLMHTDSMTIHWHGIHQRSIPEADGVAFLTQYPLLPGQSQTYKFKAFPFGNHLYHAHIGDQRTMGHIGLIQRDNVLYLLSMLFILDGFSAQSTDTEWFNYFLKTGTSCKINTCRQNDQVCECYLSIEINLSMFYKGAGSPAILLKPQNGAAVNFNTCAEFDEKIEDSFILADGFNSQQVISINGRCPGPVITAYENQNMIVHVRNLMHTDSMTIHWHGIHQRSTPEADGVAFLTQYP